ncbi:response regulator [Cohnella sp. 56]|uniref:response regulator n=1 Tax=Cohnella sp. 56 TaxID=3113722 RepID=UPI0030E7981F
MCRVLIVDDQYYALIGLQHGVDWGQLGFTDVALAENVEQAIGCLSRHGVELLICDIEMPGRSGLELLAWAEQHSPDTLTIMLTCHADFEYARLAIHHGAFHYLLKPVDYDQLTRVASDALAEIGRQRERRTFEALIREYRSKWDRHMPVLVERFWQDIVSQRTSLLPESLRRSAEASGLQFEPDARFTLVLIGVEQWKENLSARDEAIMEYALRNMAGELILSGLDGVVFQTHAGHNLAIVYERNDGAASVGALERNCRQFLSECERLLQCALSIYISPSVRLPDLVGAYAFVSEREQRNMNRCGQVFMPVQAAPASIAERTPTAAPMDMFADWATLLELGEAGELDRRTRLWFGNRGANAWTKEMHDQFTHGILLIIHTILAKKGLSVQDSETLKSLTDKMNYPKQPPALQSWTKQCLDATVLLLRESDSLSSSTVVKIKQYIRSRLSQEISRQELAAHVYLNPAYLSRMFKKETGLSLSDAIIQEKIQEAKRLLEETEYRITGIAEKVGYTSLGSFSNLFKRTVGVTPQQYRARKKSEI